MNWTVYLRNKLGNSKLVDIFLPVTLPEYAFGPAYLLGSLTASSFVVLVLSGILLTIEGPSWLVTSPVGSLDWNIHRMAVAFFFFFMGLHFLRVFFSGAWRGKREATWVIGAFLALVAVPTAITGFLLKEVWWSRHATATGQVGPMFFLHILVFPAILVALLAVHVLLVRGKSVVPPYPGKKHGRLGRRYDPRTDLVRDYRKVPADFVKHLVGTLAMAAGLTVGLAALVQGAESQPFSQGLALASTPPTHDFITTKSLVPPGTGVHLPLPLTEALVTGLIVAGLSGFSLLLVLPWIPWLNRLPRQIGVHKLIWQRYYSQRSGH